MKSGWRKIHFEDVVSDETGGNVKSPQGDFQSSGLYPIIDQGKSFVAGYTNDKHRLCKSKIPVILFGDHTKCFKYIDFPFCLGADGTKILRPKIEAHEKYLFYFLQTIPMPEAGYSRHFKYLKDSEIVLPPIQEQKRIAAILDQADALRRLRQRAIDRLNMLGQAIFYEMFGDPATNPKSWPIVTIKELTASTQYGTSSKAGDVGNFPILRMGNINESGAFDYSSLKYIDLSALDIEKYTVRDGDILFNRTNSPDLVGKTGVYRGNSIYAFAGYLVRLRVNEKAVPEYVGIYLNSPFGKKILRNMCKTIIGMANINAKELLTIPVPLGAKSCKDD
ncbi:MAG: restriction endonuclease subunit S [Candidatus Competibacteraceae bacterium]|nr:restriction endonuclease subunit S [Candidatus Competibacteraceae bacterium]MBK8964475.1 restriction endonuclease subunit S [Candidatus Competibacteraceae bacterium]